LKKQDSPYYLGARAGIPVGLYMSGMFAFFVLMTRVNIASFALLCLMACMPVVIYATMRSTVRRQKGQTTFSGLWMQGIMTFLFGSVICSLVTMLYIKFVEPDMILGLVRNCIASCEAMPGNDYAETAQIMQRMIDSGAVPSASSFTMSMFWLSMSTGSVLSLITAAIAQSVARRRSLAGQMASRTNGITE
jgi:hypothetical protein